MNQDRRGEDVYIEGNDYRLYVEILQETADRFKIKIAAYCLMPNHYHLLIHTTNENLSKSMHHINGFYTQRFNHRHKYDGQLFRDHYMNILVGADSYLLELVRYIHKNPLRARLADSLNGYQWSRYNCYLSDAKNGIGCIKTFLFPCLHVKETKAGENFKSLCEMMKKIISPEYLKKRNYCLSWEKKNS